MRWIELTESRSAPLYHFMEWEKAKSVFQTDCMDARWMHEIPSLGEVYGNSFTRNAHKHFSRPFRIAVDQLKLSSRHKIIPLDGERIFRQTGGLRFDTMRDRRINPTDALAEEFVVGAIKGLHRFISAVEMPRIGYSMPDWKMEDMRDAASRYCEQWNIPFTLDPTVAKRFEEIADNRQYDEDE